MIAYASNYIKCHYPDVFCAALLNSQPMGFYAPAQIVGDAIKHGIEVRPVCVNRSRWDCTLERIGSTDGHAIRLGFRQVKGLAVADAARIVAARMNNPFSSVDDMWRRSSVPTEALVQLAEADAFLPSRGQNKSSPKSYARAERNRNNVVVRKCNIQSLWIASYMRQF